MQEIKGAYASAKIFTDNVEEYALAQVKMICDNEAAAGSVVRVMPDVHPGKIGPIGADYDLGECCNAGHCGYRYRLRYDAGEV